jgi:hypothetical protein
MVTVVIGNPFAAFVVVELVELKPEGDQSLIEEVVLSLQTWIGMVVQVDGVEFYEVEEAGVVVLQQKAG